jgi:hypothetical protein
MRETIAQMAFSTYQFLMPAAIMVFAICVLVLFPLTFVRRTSGGAAIALFIASYLFGITVWFASAALTFSYFGWIGLILGLVFFGIGVFPMALWALFVGFGQAALAWMLIGMFIATIGTRFVGAVALARSGRS